MDIVEGILLKSVPYGENQTIVNLFTKQEGFMVMITPLHKSRRRIPYSVMQECEVEYVKNDRGGLHRLMAITPLDKASGLHLDVERGGYAQLWGSLLASLLRDQGADSALYGYVVRAVELLESYDGEYMNLTLLFMGRLATFLGVKPNIESYKRGRVFHIGRGEFIDTGTFAAGELVSGPNVAEAIYRFMTMEIERVGTLKINFKSFEILLETLLLFYEHHFAVKFDKTAIAIIKEILNG